MVRSLEDLIKNRVYAPLEAFSEIMGIIEHFRGKRLGGFDGDLRPLLEDSDSFYCKSPESGFLQGDILSGVPVSFTDSQGDAIEISEEHHIMVLSNECDAEMREKNHQAYIRYCPVYRESLLFSLLGADKSLQGAIKANKISEYFRMPTFGNDALVADLSLWCSADLPWIHTSAKGGGVSRIASLSEDAYFLLKAKLAWFLLRPTADSQRSALVK